MSFKNLLLVKDSVLKTFSEEPGFYVYDLDDINPIGGTSKKRMIEAPNKPMRAIHEEFIRYLRGLPVNLAYATGGLPGNSPLKNVQRHKYSCFFYLVDLKSAYSYVRIELLVEVLLQADHFLDKGQEDKVRQFLENYCMSQFNGLAIGAPASPDLFNLYCHFLIDEPLKHKVVIRNLLTYTRYLDDLTFSSEENPITRSTRKNIREVIKEAGFLISHPKSRLCDLKKGPIFINGVGLELGGRTFVPRSYLRYILGLIHKGNQGYFELWPKIEGAMGVFWNITDKKGFNQTEKRVVKEYRKFRRLLGK